MSGVEAEQRIEKSVEIKAPIDRVWNLLTDPSEMPRWWDSMIAAEGDPAPGGELTFTWFKDIGRTSVRVEEVEEPRLFSYRWAANAEGNPPVPGDQTRVEYRLEELGEITRVTVIETGFEDLTLDPKDTMTSLEGNTQGWEEVLGHLQAAFA